MAKEEKVQNSEEIELLYAILGNTNIDHAKVQDEVLEVDDLLSIKEKSYLMQIGI